MGPFYHRAANRAAALLMKLIFGSGGRIRILHRDRANPSGGVLLACNHISHFDPFIVSSVVRRKIDWMAMAEFFPYPIVGHFLRAVDAFPAARDRADRRTIRTAIDRLKRGRIVGIFPEGGIRDGENSILAGAQARSGVAVLTDIARVPVLPCVVLGSDRLYNRKRWLTLRRAPVWIAFGELIFPKPDLPKDLARHHTEQEFAAALASLYRELQERFSLTANDLPHSPRARMAEGL
jgi:1-acyl-sn-glycerol-3-phosphate acyltransferase